MPNLLAVIVTYHPELTQLKRLINILQDQQASVLVIDNNTPGFTKIILGELPTEIEVIQKPENVGLATAYNEGCSFAKSRGYSHVILFDQDSMPAENMVANLYSAIACRNEHTFTVAAVGPKYTDIKGQKLSPFVRIKQFHLVRVDCSELEVVEVDHLISSGSLIDLRAIDYVGNFLDLLFIDCVDTEWCLRVRHYKLKMYGVGNALMTHNIGERYLNVFGRQLPFHTPLRLRYQFRNQVWIIKQPWVGWRWRIIDLIRSTKLVAVYIFFAPDKFNNLTAIAKGIYDGIANRMGKI